VGIVYFYMKSKYLEYNNLEKKQQIMKIIIINISNHNIVLFSLYILIIKILKTGND